MTEFGNPYTFEVYGSGGEATVMWDGYDAVLVEPRPRMYFEEMDDLTAQRIVAAVQPIYDRIAWVMSLSDAEFSRVNDPHVIGYLRHPSHAR